MKHESCIHTHIWQIRRTPRAPSVLSGWSHTTRAPSRRTSVCAPVCTVRALPLQFESYCVVRALPLQFESCLCSWSHFTCALLADGATSRAPCCAVRALPLQFESCFVVRALPLQFESYCAVRAQWITKWFTRTLTSFQGDQFQALLTKQHTRKKQTHTDKV